MARRKGLFIVGLALPLILTSVGPSSALTVTLDGTGFDRPGHPLASGGVDGSWTILGPGFVRPAPAFFIGPGNPDWWTGGGNPLDAYFPNTNAATFNGSGWISNTASSPYNGTASYTFYMTFDLSSFDVTSVTIAGQWSIADAGVLGINGHHIVESLSGAWQTLHPFTITVHREDLRVKAVMKNPGRRHDEEFAWVMSFLGGRLLRQARQKAMSLPPAAEDQSPELTLSKAAREAFDRLLEEVYALPEDKQLEATILIAHGMILEDLRLASRTSRA